MKALLYKDFLVLWKQMKFVIFLVAAFCITPITTGFSMNAFFIIYAGLMVPITLFAYDERAKWDSLAAMMPFSTKDLVLSRYVFGWLGTVYAILCCCVGQGLFESGFSSAQNLILLGTIVALLLVVQSVYFPILFRLGAEKGRMIMMAVIIGLMVVAAMLFGVLEKLSVEPSLPTVTLCVLAALALCLGSVKVSVKQYEQRVW